LQSPDPELKIMDPDPTSDPELDFNLIKNHQNIRNLQSTVPVPSVGTGML
jgi:hypothetical protein